MLIKHQDAFLQNYTEIFSKKMNPYNNWKSYTDKFCKVIVLNNQTYTHVFAGVSTP